MQPLLQLLGQLLGVRVEQDVDLREVVRLDDAGAVGGLALLVDERLVADGLVGLGIAGAKGRVAGVDAAVDDGPRQVPAGDGEEAPGGVGLDGQRGPRHRRRRLAIQAHGVDHGARLRPDAPDQLRDGHDQLEPVGLRRRRDALLRRREGPRQPSSSPHDGQRPHHPDHPQEIRAHAEPSPGLLRARPDGLVLRILDRLREPALRGLLLDVVDRPVLREAMPPLGHRQHDTDQVLEVEGGGDRGQVVDDARKRLRCVAEGAPRRGPALDGQALTNRPAHLARRHLAVRRQEQLDRRKRVGRRSATPLARGAGPTARVVRRLLRVLEPDVGEHRGVLREAPGPTRPEEQLLHQVPVELLQRAGAPTRGRHGPLRSGAARAWNAGAGRQGAPPLRPGPALASSARIAVARGPLEDQEATPDRPA